MLAALLFDPLPRLRFAVDEGVMKLSLGEQRGGSLDQAEDLSLPFGQLNAGTSPSAIPSPAHARQPKRHGRSVTTRLGNIIR